MILGVMVLSIILDTKIAEAYKVEEVQAVVTVIEPQQIQIEITYSEASIKKRVMEAFPNNPVMLRVVSCEGGFRADAFNPTNGSNDRGPFQISERSHGNRAKQLGLDLKNPVDNIAFAKILYKESGLHPWSASKKCWSK